MSVESEFVLWPPSRLMTPPQNHPPKIVVKQLMPAPDWLAVFEEDDGQLWFTPLVGWAVVPGYLFPGEDAILPLYYAHDTGVSVVEADNWIGTIHVSQRNEVEDLIIRKKRAVTGN